MTTVPGNVQVTGLAGDRYDEILTPGALRLLAELHGQLGERRAEALAARQRRQARLSAGENLAFLPETAHIREDKSWRVAPLAGGLEDRRVEITGPTDRKMTINALNSGANVWLADFEDANTPLWENMIGGQLNLKDALDRTIDFESGGKSYALNPDETLATIVARPRGWHLDEKHILIDGRRASGSLTDFALYMAASGQKQIDKGKGPYFYLPKMESHLEARLWNDAFVIAQDFLGIPRGTIRATVLIETIPAAFEMDEILYELKDHSAGLNAGRWDYLFSIIKKFRTRGREFLLPERNAVTMTAPMMRAYTDLLVKTCHARGTSAMGGMAAFIPSRRDPEVNATALAKVREDKTREATDGFDGSWVAHPDLVAICKEVFDGVLAAAPNQIGRQRPEVSVTAEDLLSVNKTPGAITEAGLRNNISVGLQYLAAWLGGNGAVAIFNLMEDAATAEISRSQIWQWLHNDVTLDDGRRITKDLVERLIGEELAKIRELAEGSAAGNFDSARYGQAVALFTEVALADEYAEFLTIPAYERMPLPATLVKTTMGPIMTTAPTARTAPTAATTAAAGPAAATTTANTVAATAAELAGRMRAICGPEHVVTDPLDLRTYECDGLTAHRATPALVVLPGAAEEVAAVVRECARHGIPFVARGSGTGLSGGAVPRSDGVLIVMTRMRKILEIDPVARRAVLEPGVTNLSVTGAATGHGLFYAPDPSSQVICSVGGNVAENSGGAHCLKHGFTVHHVTGLEIVTTDGELTWLGDGTGITAGYDLLGAFTGSEGTLGIVTKIVVKLTPSPQAVHLVLAAYDTLADGGRAVSDIIGAGIVPAAIEMMDALAIEAAEAAVACGYPEGAGAVLLVELDGPAAEVEAELATVRDICDKAGAREIRAADDPATRAGIWKGRKSAFAAVGRLSPAYIVQDGVVPRTALGDVLGRISDLSKESGIRVANVFHAGDGNLHPLVLYNDASEAETEAAEELSGQILDACIEYGGSITGEHGVGLDKSRYMPKMFTAEDLDTMQLVRCAFDPASLCDPGKIFPTPRLCGEVPGHHRAPHPAEAAGQAQVF